MEQGAALGLKVRDWFTSLPFFTKVFFGLNCVVFVLSVNRGKWCAGPQLLYISSFNELHELLRLWVSPLVHLNFFHIFFNMFVWQDVGPAVETMLGSMNLLFFVLFLMVGGNCLSIVLSWHLSFLDYWFLQRCSMGFSGVIFGFIVVHSHYSSAETRSMFGFFDIPAKAYPWILLLLLQVMSQSISLEAHLAGMMIAYLFIYGPSTWLLPSRNLVSKIESVSGGVDQRGDYKPHVDSPFTQGAILPTMYAPNLFLAHVIRSPSPSTTLPATTTPATSTTSADNPWTGTGRRVGD